MEIKISKIANLPSKRGQFQIQSFKEGEKERLCTFKGKPSDTLNLRIHSERLTGNDLGSLKCDRGEQFEFVLGYIEQNGGMVIYLRQEGRNIGLFNKVNAYALQDEGLNIIEANEHLDFKPDEGTYEVVDFVLNYCQISQINLITDNPNKLNFLESKLIKRIPILIKSNPYNDSYFKIKQDSAGHLE